MGMYTEFEFSATLKDSIEDLQINDGHYFFDCRRWECLISEEDLNKAKRRKRIDLYTNIKNYSDEIESFMDWISPHVKELVDGRYTYETNYFPSVIYLKNNVLHTFQVRDIEKLVKDHLNHRNSESDKKEMCKIEFEKWHFELSDYDEKLGRIGFEYPLGTCFYRDIIRDKNVKRAMWEAWKKNSK